MGTPIKIINTRPGPAELRFRERQRQQAFVDGKYRIPTNAMPFYYAMAVVQLVLLHNKAIEAYHLILDSWKLPECQYSISAVFLNEVKWYEDSEHFKQLIEAMNNFILIGFNREIDRKNKKWKVLPDIDKPLFRAVITWSIMDTLGINPNDWTKYRDLVRDGKTYDTEGIMQNQHNDRLHRELNQTLKRYGKLVDTEKLLHYANQWYGCRVEPGTIELYLNQVSETETLERGNIETAIAPYDSATGYDRRWHK